MDVKILPGKLFLFILLYNLLFLHNLPAQDVKPSVKISGIRIYGNNITKAPVILRELPFKAGDVIPSAEYSPKITAAKENIFNTNLFNFVTIDSTGSPDGDNRVTINIRVIEKWYIWPWPYFEMSDRNFNAWWETKDFSRLTYGIDFTFQNVRGRDETVKIPVHFGFNQLYGFFYQAPYINRKKTLGLEFGGDIALNHEVVVTSVDNKPVYLKDQEEYLRQDLNIVAGLTVRRNIYVTHTFRFAYDWMKFADTVENFPNYCASVKDPDFLSFYYQFKSDHRDVHYYPLKGYYIDLEFYKYGFFQEIDESSIKTNIRKYWHIHNRWYFATGITLKASLTGSTDYYFLQKGLGYGRDFVRGYEYYVVDGQQYGLMKNNLKFAIIPQRVITLSGIRSKKFNTVPVALYMNVFTDLGFVNNRSKTMNDLNDLENALLVGYGAGLDFTTYYNIVIRVEGSFNGMGEPGIYLHFMAPI